MSDLDSDYSDDFQVFENQDAFTSFHITSRTGAFKNAQSKAVEPEKKEANDTVLLDTEMESPSTDGQGKKDMFVDPVGHLRESKDLLSALDLATPRGKEF